MRRVLFCAAALAVCAEASDEVVVFTKYANRTKATNELARVEVTARGDIAANQAVSVVDAEAIKDAEATNVAEALRSVAGVYFTDNGYRGESSVRLRGFGPTRVGVFIDGIPVYVPFDRNTDLARFTTYDVGEITVSKGYTSPLFGANTLGGAINIITRKPAKEFEGEVGAGVMNGKGAEEWATLGTKQELFYALLSASHSERDYYKISQDYEPKGAQQTHRRANSDHRDYKLNLKVGLTPRGDDEYSFNYIMARGEHGQPYADDASGGGLYKRFWRWPDWDKTSYYLITKTAITESFEVKSRWYYDGFYNLMEDYGNATATRPIGTSEYDDYTFGGIVEGDWRITPDQTLKLSLSRKYDRHKEIDSASKGADIKMGDHTVSIGAEYALRFLERFTWVAGASYDRTSVDRAQYRDSSKSLIAGSHPSFSSDSINPETALYFQATPAWMLYGSISRKAMMPTLKDRYSTQENIYLYNPSLKQERSTTYEIGTSYDISSDTRAQIALFWTRTDDYIARIRGLSNSDAALGCVGQGTCSQNQNVGEEEHKGYEVSIESQISPELFGTMGYTYIDAKVKNGGGVYVTDTPKHSFAASFKYTPRAWIDVIPTLRHESARYVNLDGSNRGSSLTIADLKIALRPIKALELGVGVKNIFDELYYYDSAFPLEGRSYYANVRYNF
jgi:iron complex outermembrane receptor protein